MKKYIFSILFAIFFGVVSAVSANQSQFQLSTHVLDISLGTSPSNIVVELSQKVNKQWKKIDTKKTDKNGRINTLLPTLDNEGTYLLRFYTEDYLRSMNIETIYPYIEITFIVKKGQHYHIPVLLAGNGYSTYRGN